jgi:N-acetylneuraminate synthase
MINRNVFDELFVLELANNHWGDVERGLRIIKDFSTVVRYHNVRAAIKLQFRDVDNFIHKDFRDRADIRYIKKTIDTQLSVRDLAALTEAVRRNGCVRMATPFDEASVDLCERLDVEIIKIASSDITDWVLLERIAKTRKPVIVSTGGASLKDMDSMVTFFENRNIPLAINHCVSIYPSEDAELEMNQIDFLKARYPNHTVGFSTHEYHDWTTSMLVAYAKGARTFERHIDIKTPDKPFTPYCSTPENVSEWFGAFKKAKELCGGSASERRHLPEKEVAYLDALVRGVYLKRDLPAGHALTDDDFYLAIPLQRGQLSCRELISGEVLVKPARKDEALRVEHFDNPYSRSPELRAMIERRGLDTGPAPAPAPSLKKAAGHA